MHDRQYREAIAWQNVAYNQPPHPSFFLGDGMAAAARAEHRDLAAARCSGPPRRCSRPSRRHGRLGHRLRHRTTRRWSSRGTAHAGHDGHRDPLRRRRDRQHPRGRQRAAGASTTRARRCRRASTRSPPPRPTRGGITGPPSPPFSVPVDTTPPARARHREHLRRRHARVRGTAEAGQHGGGDAGGHGRRSAPPGRRDGQLAARLCGAGACRPARTRSPPWPPTCAGNPSAASAPSSVDTAVAAPAIVAGLRRHRRRRPPTASPRTTRSC